MHFSGCKARARRMDKVLSMARKNTARGITMIDGMIDRRMIRGRCHKQKPHSLIVFVAGIVLAAVAQAEPYDASSMWQLQRLGDPDISPDGRLAVVPVTRYDVGKNKGETDLWLVPTKPGKARQLTSSGGTAATPVWSPDGETIAFVAKRGED